MRRYLLYCAMFSGLLVTAASHGAVTHPRASAGHSFVHSAGRAANRAQGLPTRSSHRVSIHAGAQTALLRARTQSVALKPVQPVTTALIDPVPRGKFVFPPPLKGSHDSLVRQNVRSQEDGLERVQDDDDLLALRRQKQLVAVPVTNFLLVDERLPANRRFCRPWTAQFLSDLSRVHYGRFHRPLQINSAVRTVEYQRHLELVNGNAAPAEGEDASPHLTGGTIDIAKKGLSMTEIVWVRAYLMPLQTAGKIDVEEEFYQSCFHITVYRSYRPDAPPSAAKTSPNSQPSGSAALLAARIR